MKNNKGFSLVELIVVIAIMAILAAVAIPTFATFITKANKASDVSFVNDATYAAELAAASSAQKVNGITVKVTTAKKASEITIMIDNDTSTDTEIIVDADDANYSGSDVTELIKKEVASMVDWNYTFKSVKPTAETTYKLNATGDALE